MITNIYFVRHAEPDYSIHDDEIRPLTEKGTKDSLKVIDFLKDKNIEIALSSPYKRAIDTIKPFLDINNLEHEFIEDFRERRINSCWIEDFQGFSKKQWEDFDYKLSDGECLREVQERNIGALKSVVSRFEGKNIVVGTHGTALSTIINFYVPSFGYECFNEIKGRMPWVVRFTFDGEGCIEIEGDNKKYL